MLADDWLRMLADDEPYTCAHMFNTLVLHSALVLMNRP